ncbi:MAG: UvrD-helicase domain-containing protein [Thainema sp.]
MKLQTQSVTWINSELTDQQQAAAYASHSIAVTAGAGTGKTHMLAERYFHHLMSGHSPLEIVALTFTNKAAAELRSRIRKTIRDRTTNSAIANQLKADGTNAFEILAELEAAQISTFHALAERICREHPEVAGVPADFTVLDELEGRIWQDQVLLDAIAHLPIHLYETVPYSLMQSAIQAFMSDPLTAEEALGKGRDDWFPVVQQLRQNALDQLVNHEQWLSAADVLHVYAAPGDKLDAMREKALEAMASLEQGHNVAESLVAMAALKINCGAQKNWGGKETLDLVKQAIRELRDDVVKPVQEDGLITLEPNLWDDQTEAILPVLREGFEQVRSHLDQAKRQQRVLNFNDLEIHALRALESEAIRDYYAQRWQVYLIDEFQDTNPIQGRLLNLLTDGKLRTIVGDVKQSIYGFRRADVRVFQHWCEQISQDVNQQDELLNSDVKLNNHKRSGHDPAVQSLSLSFRTHHALVQNINTVFQPILADLHQPLAAHRQAEPHAAPHLQVYAVQPPDEVKPSLDERRRAEGQHIANLIKGWISDGIQVHDKEMKQLRPITYGDIAILARTWSSLELYGEVLESQGIPMLQAGGGNLLDTREAKDAWAMLRFLTNPADDLALVAVLRSPFFAISDRTLQRLAQTLPEKTAWWQHLKANQVNHSELNHPVQTLQTLLKERRSDPPARLLQRADRLTGYTAAIAHLPNARRREADWRGFLDFVKAQEQGRFDGLSIVRTLRRLIAAEVSIPRPPLEAGNAVSLMTIHAAKGLEWPIVIVPDLSRKESSSYPTVRFDADLGVALKLQDEQGETQKSALYTLLEQQQKQADEAEAKRLLYVALTRSRDRIVLTTPEENQGLFKVLQAGLGGPTDIQPIPFDPALAYSSAHDLQVDINELSPVPPPAVLTQSCGSGLSELPVTALTDYALCPKRFEYRHIENHIGYYELEDYSGEPPELDDGLNDELEGAIPFVSGTTIGTLTHLALQHGIQDAETLAEKYGADLPADAIAHALKDALALAQNFRTRAIYQPYRNATGHYEKSIQFAFNGLTLNGIIDLLTDDFVLDFKTDRHIHPHHHRLQLWAYAQATQRPSAHIAYLRHDHVHTFDTAALQAVEEDAVIAVNHILRGEFVPTPSEESCGICPYAVMCDRSLR